MSTINDNIRALTTEEQYAAGLALFESGGVMNVKYASRIVDAKVVNDSFAFERVTVQQRAEKLLCRCSCMHNTTHCKHIIALLLYIAKETPELLNCLVPKDGGPQQESAPTPRQSAPQISDSSVSMEALRDFLSSAKPPLSLHLECKTELPQLILSRQRLSIIATIHHNGTVYTQGNIPKLVENGAAAGKMKIADFEPQSQQVMRFLNQYAQFEQQELSLDSECCADLFHCLRGSNILHTPSGIVQFHLEPLQIRFQVTRQDQDVTVIHPCLFVPSRGALPEGDLSFIAGRGGYWLGKKLEYWWFPGIIPFNWLRMFLQGQDLTLSAEEFTRLSKFCETQCFPGKIDIGSAAQIQGIVKGVVRPVLSLDWDKNGLSADLSFDYSGKRVEVAGELSFWTKSGFVLRNQEEENKAKSIITEAGFKPNNESWQGMRLEDDGQIWHFIQDTLPQLMLVWQVFCTPQVRINASATANAQMSLRSTQEGNGWFETTCDLKSADGKPIPFDLVAEAVDEGKDFIRLPNGSVIHLPQEIFNLLEALIKRATQRKDNQFNLKRFHAVALVDDLVPYWQGPRPDWFSLKEKIMHPEKLAPLRLPRQLDSVLRDYQKEGVKWLSILEECGFHGVLADEMGLGKTAQALALLALHKKRAGSAPFPSMVICPTSLLENWRAEALKFTPKLKVMIIRGLDRAKLFSTIPDYDLIITSYALFRRDLLEYDQYEFDYVILDEAQHIKNPRTANAQACKDLKADHRLVLTGTPMENSPSEIWSLFDFLQPGYLGCNHDFRQTYEAKNDPQKQTEVAKRLAGIIRPFVLRRTKNEVCKELPPKLEQNMYCEMGEDQRKLYEHLLLASRSFLAKLQEAGMKIGERKIEMLSMITRLRQACCHPGLLPREFLKAYPKEIPSVKLDLAKEVILEAIDSGHRLLLFSQFTSILDLFPTWLDEAGIKYEMIVGSTKNRQERVDRFNADTSIPVFLLSLKAGGVGLNLPGADTVIHFDQWWNPMVEDQATDRTHRIGQTRTVTSIRLITKDTIEEKILKLQDKKRDLFNKVLGDAPSAINDITDDDIDFLLK